MSKLIIRNLANISIPITPDKSLLKLIQEAHIDWMHACGGKGRCTTCRIRILAGMENMSSYSTIELKFKDQGRLQETERLACQSYAHGDILAEVPFECQLPHIKYSR